MLDLDLAELYGSETKRLKEVVRRLRKIRRSITAELQMVSETANKNWKLATEKLFNRLSSTHLNAISAIDNPIKRAFYEMGTIRRVLVSKKIRATNSLFILRV